MSTQVFLLPSETYERVITVTTLDPAGDTYDYYSPYYYSPDYYYCEGLWPCLLRTCAAKWPCWLCVHDLCVMTFIETSHYQLRLCVRACILLHA